MVLDPALRRPIAWVIATAIAASLLLLAPVNAPPAEAETACTVQHEILWNGARSRPTNCMVRTYVDCRTSSSPVTQRVYGPSVPSGIWSYAYCPTGYTRVFSGWIRTG